MCVCEIHNWIREKHTRKYAGKEGTELTKCFSLHISEAKEMMLGINLKARRFCSRASWLGSIFTSKAPAGTALEHRLDALQMNYDNIRITC